MILLTGGTGLLGMELQKIWGKTRRIYDAPQHKHFDIANFDFDMRKFRNKMEDVKLIVHCAAYTNVLTAEIEKDLCYKTNVIGTRNLAALGIPMVYISTEYVFDGDKGNYREEEYPNPKNFYSLTKLLGEYEAGRTKSIIIRCLFKPRPFQHEKACIDQFTTGDYVDVIAPEISFAIKNFHKLPSVIHIGTKKKSTYDLARQSRKVEPITISEIKNVKLPRDTSLNCSKWQELKCKLISQNATSEMKR